MAKNGFNDEQNLALDNPIDVDLQVSAGAGSGKTKTLSEKVMRLIEGGLNASELLVLTFTNNAAHEMKERIIDKFKDREDIALQLASAHIQTFDSFSQYLVSLYSGRLQIAEQISIVDQNIIETKKKEYVEEVFEKYYFDPQYREQFKKTLLKFNLSDDNVTKLVVLDLLKNIEKLPPNEQDKFLNHYDETFLSKEFFNNNIRELVLKAKKIIEDAIFNAYFIEQHYDAIDDGDYLTLKEIFNKKENFNFDIKNIAFEDELCADPLYQALLSLLNIDDNETFINKVKTFVEDNDAIVPKKSPSSKQKETIAYSILLGPINRNKTHDLSFITELGDLEEEYNKMLYFQNDIHLLLGIVKEVFNKLNEYKKLTNSYTFSDISYMALALMNDPQYEDIAEDIRSRFKFIMVDEYQDSNDLQEMFIESLLKPNKKGERSHLFCVGDAKQSIYAFRDSNVELFRNRQRRYEDADDSLAKAIPMNKNYRSGKQLLQDINHICNFYMTMDHGGIAYNQESESLQYDDEINLYKEPYDNFGVFRIVSKSSIHNDNCSYGAKEWEARAIASDIAYKLKTQYKVSRRTKEGNKIDACKKSDFCILVGVNSCVDLYQKVFQEYGIPLNCKIKKDLYEVNVVRVIKSLLGLMNYIKLGKQSDPVFAHMFASVARSYLYEYDDQTLYDLLNDSTHQYVRLSNDPIVIKATEFMINHDKSSFGELFIDLLNEFKIIEKLYKLGDVDDSLTKIESLYQMAISQQKSGEGISEFVELLDNIDKFKTELSSESLYQEEDAVDLMTIHGSKGLERKIVYMPCSFNYIAKGKVEVKPDYIFSRKLGILLPYYNYQFTDVPLEETSNGFSTLSITHLMHSQLNEEAKIKIDEHVRLFYVALTRAENSVFIVGDLAKINESVLKEERRKDKPYGMLSWTPYYPFLEDEYIQRKIKEGVVKQESYDLYLKYVSYMQSIKRELTNDDLSLDNYYRYSSLWKSDYLDVISKKILEYVSDIEKQLFASYFHQFQLITDPNRLAKIFASFYYGDDSISTVKDLVNHKNNIQQDDDSEEESESFALVINKDNVLEILNKFKSAVETCEGLEEFGLKFSKKALEEKMDGDVPILLVDTLLLIFAKEFDHQERIKSISFKCDEYEDRTYVFDYKNPFMDKKEDKEPSLLKLSVNDEHIEFRERVHLQASKSTHDEDLPSEILDYGTHLHRLLELVDFHHKDTSFIKDESERQMIDKVLQLGIFSHLENALIYQEYGYYDDELLSNGSIDLLIVKDGQYYIIDYKTNYINDEEYISQLHTYQRNVQRIFNVENTNNIHLYLLSIKRCSIKKIE